VVLCIEAGNGEEETSTENDHQQAAVKHPESTARRPVVPAAWTDGQTTDEEACVSTAVS